MAFVNQEDYLAHYGVKGMRWGVKKAVQYARFGAQKTRAGVKSTIRKVKSPEFKKTRQKATLAALVASPVVADAIIATGKKRKRV